MPGYRSYYFATDNHISERLEFQTDNDDLAIIEARARYAESEHCAGFELWQQSRLVYSEGRVSQAS